MMAVYLSFFFGKKKKVNKERPLPKRREENRRIRRVAKQYESTHKKKKEIEGFICPVKMKASKRDLGIYWSDE